jgi:hypothetical protein
MKSLCSKSQQATGIAFGHDVLEGVTGAKLHYRAYCPYRDKALVSNAKNAIVVGTVAIFSSEKIQYVSLWPFLWQH